MRTSSPSRLSATTILVALVAAMLIAITSAPADASRTKRTRAFSAPTAHTLVDIDCDRIDDNTWEITYKWAVKGGRYTNLGNGHKFNRNTDNVWRGGRRTVITGTTIHGWGDGPAAAPETDEAIYSHYVAPIGNRSNMVELRDTQEVNLPCK